MNLRGTGEHRSFFGDGKTSTRIVDVLGDGPIATACVRKLKESRSEIEVIQ